MDWDYLRRKNIGRLGRLNLPPTTGSVKVLIFDVDVPYTLDILPEMTIYPNTTKQGMHGTFCGQVVKLVYPAVELYGCGYEPEIEKIINYAIDSNIKVISASITFRHTTAKEAALKKYYDWGGIFVAAAGNDGGKSVRYPGRSPYTICVSATDSEDCNGPEIDVTADSNWFVRNKEPGMYHSFNGTSASTPVIAGCVAHIIARYPDWNCEDVRAYLKQHSTPLSEPHERFFSFPDNWGKEEEPVVNKPEYIIIHHSATTQGDAETFRKAHKAKGWKDIGYHYVIGNGTGSGDGEVETGRAETEEGAHAKGYNTKSIGVCLVGNFDVTKPTAAQWVSLKSLCRAIMARYNIPPLGILGHGEVAATNCPGKYMDVSKLIVEVSGVEKTDYKGHWAESAIEAVKAAGIMSGYPDGTFRPDQSVTRAELAAVVGKLIERGIAK